MEREEEEWKGEIRYGKGGMEGGRKERTKDEGTKKGMQEEGKEGEGEGRKEGMNDGTKEERKEGRKELIND